MNSNDLVQAAFAGNLILVQKLVQAGADINAMGKHWNPLHAAIENEQVTIIKYLLANGADIEYDCNGMRPLHHAIDIEIDAATQSNAADFPEPTLTKLLLEQGANPLGKNATGQTALQMAQERNHKKAIAILFPVR